MLSDGRNDGKKLIPNLILASAARNCVPCRPRRRRGSGYGRKRRCDEHPDPDEETIRHYRSGNLCRCAAYPEIIDAVKLAAVKRRRG
ncbi:MAG: 2Fe-2S iron-sulfur cluster-binding protein [Burkholderiales bacterium]